MQFDELALLTDMSVDTLRQCAQELGRGSLITYESDTRGGIASRIGPSLAVRAYLPRESLDAVLVAQLLEREQELRKGVERRREDESSRLLAPWTVHVRTEDDEPTAHLLRRALREGHRKSFDDASETIERARQLNPDYFEVDRVDAIVSSWAKQSVRAVELYRSALESCTDDRSRAIVSHFFAGHLAREMHDVPLAISYEREAHGHLQTSETAMALGNLLVWNREFVEGQEYLEAALDGASGTNRLIALTATVDSWRRWAEYLLGERKVSDGFEKARAGFFLGIRELDANVVDLKLGGSVVEALGVAAECFLTPGSQIPEGSNRIEEMVARVYPNRRLLESTRPWRRSVTRLGRIMRYDGSSPSLIASVRNLLRVESAAQNSVEEDHHQWLVGRLFPTAEPMVSSVTRSTRITSSFIVRGLSLSPFPSSKLRDAERSSSSVWVVTVREAEGDECARVYYGRVRLNRIDRPCLSRERLQRDGKSAAVRVRWGRCGPALLR